MVDCVTGASCCRDLLEDAAGARAPSHRSQSITTVIKAQIKSEKLNLRIIPAVFFRGGIVYQLRSMILITLFLNI